MSKGLGSLPSTIRFNPDNGKAETAPFTVSVISPIAAFIKERIFVDLPEFAKEISPETGEYNGDTTEDKPHGLGMFIYNNGYHYDGQWANGRKHGWGFARLGDKRWFKGTFSEN